MAKLTANQIGLHLDEHEKLECELNSDEQDREHWEEYQTEAEQEWAARFDDSWMEDQLDSEVDCGYDRYDDPYPMIDDWWDY